jgi:hypothetical protein
MWLPIKDRWTIFWKVWVFDLPTFSPGYSVICRQLLIQQPTPSWMM